ncbi:MAG: cytochrome P450 [Nitrospira sp.]|nr:MAG: cytochrome P450 [Nitrospira sp.]
MSTTSNMQAYNLLTTEARANPYPIYANLRKDDPVHWSELLHVWILTRYDDVLAALRDPALSSDRLKQYAAHQLHGLDLNIVSDYLRVANRMMIIKDVPLHTRLRRMTSESFTKSALDVWRPIVQKVMDRLLDQIQGAERMDLVSDFAQPLPALVIAEMFGIAEEDRDSFQRWSDDISKFWGGSFGNIEEDGRRANEAMVRLEQHFLNIIHLRRENPGDDLMSHLIVNQERGLVDAEELTAQCVLILVAGHVTTIDQISNGLYALLTHPEEMQKLREQPEVINSAVEEILRFDSSVPFIHRVAKEDIVIRGRRIAKGQVVFLGLAAANRDPEQFAEPDRFDITRQPNKHVAFAVGPHLCLGAELARRELALGVAALCNRFPKLRFTNEPPERRYDSLMFRGFKSMPLAF